jgi:Uma2 family endonuclease
VTENDKVKLLWDFDIQTDRVIQARRPDIVVVEKENKKTWIIDVAVPADRRIEKDRKISRFSKGA